MKKKALRWGEPSLGDLFASNLELLNHNLHSVQDVDAASQCFFLFLGKYMFLGKQQQCFPKKILRTPKILTIRHCRNEPLLTAATPLATQEQTTKTHRLFTEFTGYPLYLIINMRARCVQFLYAMQ